MRTFYEEWEILDSTKQAGQISEKTSGSLELVNSKTENIPDLSIWNLQVPNYNDFPMDAFLHIGFTHHRVILRKVKSLDERMFYIRRCANEHFTVEFFNRELNCLVAVELKRGKFKTSYLGQLQGYLSVLDGYEPKLHENQIKLGCWK